MTKVLITGISGFLGHYLYKYKPQNIDLYGTYFSNKPAQPGINLLRCDLNKLDSIFSQANKFDVIIHCAANSSLGSCQKNPDEAYLINANATRKLAQWSAEQQSKFIFLSTDIVFAGDKGKYNENDIPNPINNYGKTKQSAENSIMELHSNAIIVRLSLCLGRGFGNTRGFIDWFFTKIKNNEKIPLYYDEIRTPVSARFAARSIWELANLDFIGIIHLAGKEKIDRYELGLKILDNLKIKKFHLLQKTSSENSPYPRPKDVSLTSNVHDNIFQNPQEDLNTLIKNVI